MSTGVLVGENKNLCTEQIVRQTGAKLEGGLSLTRDASQ